MSIRQESWDGVRNATRFSAECYQPLGDGFDVNHKLSEDCLYLNVFTPPVDEANNLPVM